MSSSSQMKESTELVDSNDVIQRFFYQSHNTTTSRIFSGRTTSGYVADEEGAAGWSLPDESTMWSLTSSGMAVEEQEEECDHYPGHIELRAFHDTYNNYHGYVAAIVCAFGIVANILNIVILTRRSMVSATNCILTGLAISDGLTMVAYLPFALRFYVLYGTDVTPERNTLSAVRFMLFYACFSVVVHTISIWLTVTLAVFRCICVKYPRYAVTWCTLYRAKMAVLLVYVISVVVCIPNFATYKLQDERVTTTVTTSPSDIDSKNLTSTDHASVISLRPIIDFLTPPPTLEPPNPYDVDNVTWTVRFKSETDSDKFLYSLNFWVQALLVKLVPCVGLTVLSFVLVLTMRKADAKHRRLRLSSATNKKSGFGSPPGCPSGVRQGCGIEAGAGDEGCCSVSPSTGCTFVTVPTTRYSARRIQRHMSRARNTNRTTRMLLVVVVLFIVTEFPHGIINLVSGLSCERFLDDVYMHLGDLMDILALINNGINFILYCTMSKQFRDHFAALFTLNSAVVGSSLSATTAVFALKMVRRNGAATSDSGSRAGLRSSKKRRNENGGAFCDVITVGGHTLLSPSRDDFPSSRHLSLPLEEVFHQTSDITIPDE